MATNVQERWDVKHLAEPGRDEPAPFLKQLLEQSSWRIQRGRALDIATGMGRNAIFLAGLGFQVDAVDISEAGLAEARKRAAVRGLSVDFRQTDLNAAELAEAGYDLIVDFNYLDRSLIPKMKRALKLGGHIVFETYLIDQRVLGHPRNPAYLLGHNELLELFRDFRVLYYREGKFSEGERESYRAGLLAQKMR
ncbi:MAG: class I SAM-dependent methyltransferase [Candidatus Binatia bacterium]